MARCEGRLSKQKEHSPAISSTAAQKERKKKKKNTHTHTRNCLFCPVFSPFFFFLCGSLSSGKRIVIIIIFCINCFAWPYFQLPIFVCVFKKNVLFEYQSLSLSLCCFSSSLCVADAVVQQLFFLSLFRLLLHLFVFTLCFYHCVSESSYLCFFFLCVCVCVCASAGDFYGLVDDRSSLFIYFGPLCNK